MRYPIYPICFLLPFSFSTFFWNNWFLFFWLFLWLGFMIIYLLYWHISYDFVIKWFLEFTACTISWSIYVQVLLYLFMYNNRILQYTSIFCSKISFIEETLLDAPRIHIWGVGKMVLHDKSTSAFLTPYIFGYFTELEGISGI